LPDEHAEKQFYRILLLTVGSQFTLITPFSGSNECILPMPEKGVSFQFFTDDFFFISFQRALKEAEAFELGLKSIRGFL